MVWFRIPTLEIYNRLLRLKIYLHSGSEYGQKYISEFTGISASFLSDLENGKKTIELDKALRIANLLGLDVELNERG